MKIEGFHHIGLWVKDSQKSLDFYTKVLGGRVNFSFPMPGNDSKTIYLVDLGNNAVVEIIPRGNGVEEVDPHWVHVALRTGDARGAYAQAVEAGAESRSEPKDITLGTMPVCNAFIYGPDKEVIEFFQVKA